MGKIMCKEMAESIYKTWEGINKLLPTTKQAMKNIEKFFSKISKEEKVKPIVPVVLYIDDNTYIDVELFEQYRELAKKWIWHQQGLVGIMLEIGKSFFVFDIESCEFVEEKEK